jgi:hypothetical protein
MLASTSNAPRRFFPFFLVAAPLLLAHCTFDKTTTWTDPNNATPAAALDVAQPIDATGHIAENDVGQPVSVQITMTQTGPGTCSENPDFLGCGAIGNETETDCTTCSGPNTSLDFQLSAVGCDDDLCDVVGIQHGDAATGNTVTIVPRAGMVTVRATGTSGSLVASGSVQVVANCIHTPTAPDCQ